MHMLTISSTCSTYYCIFFSFHSFAKQFGHDDWQGYGSFIYRWTKWYGIVNKQFAVQKSRQQMQMNWRSGHILYLFLHLKATPQVIFTMVTRQLYSTNLFLRTYCYVYDKPAGSTKCKDRLTLLIITNMDGSDHRKLSVIGKAKNPHCLQKKYKMTVNEMTVDWYASKYHSLCEEEIQEEISREIPCECGEQQRCKHNPEAIGYCSCNKHGS